MKKEEMQEHHSHYMRMATEASAAERVGKHREAIRIARKAWPHVDGLLLFDRRFGGRTITTVDAIDVILRCAPLLLDYKALVAVACFLNECKRVEREVPGYTASLTSANARLHENHRLWSYLDQQGEVGFEEFVALFGGDKDDWHATLDAWSTMRLVLRTTRGRSHVFRLITRLGEVVRAKCPGCGKLTNGPKRLYLEPSRCDACNALKHFVIMEIAI